MNITAWIVFGLVTGIIANVVDPHPERGGLIGALILGILGAILGGIIGNIIFGISLSGFNMLSFAIAVLGSLLLLFIGRAFGKA